MVLSRSYLNEAKQKKINRKTNHHMKPQPVVHLYSVWISISSPWGVFFESICYPVLYLKNWSLLKHLWKSFSVLLFSISYFLRKAVCYLTTKLYLRWCINSSFSSLSTLDFFFMLSARRIVLCFLSGTATKSGPPSNLS